MAMLTIMRTIKHSYHNNVNMVTNDNSNNEYSLG